MYKLLAGTLTAACLVLLASCVTVKAVTPGGALTPDNGYIVIVFTNKIEPIAFGSREVYMVLRKVDSGRTFYLPFSAGGELRLIAVPPGNYQIKDFVYMVGSGSVEGKDTLQEIPGLLDEVPRRPRTTIVRAGYPDSFRKEFTVNAGQIIYIGDYSWESKFTFNEAAVAINKSFQSDGSVFFAVRRDHPDMPDSMTFLSLPD